MEGDSAVFGDSVSDAGFSRPDQAAAQQAGDASKLDASSAGESSQVFSYILSLVRQIANQRCDAKNH